jgi:hypothetical protein
MLRARVPLPSARKNLEPMGGGMTTYQLWMVVLGIGGFLLTAGVIIGGCVWAVAKIKEDVTAKIAEERTRTGELVDAERENFQRSMKDQTEEFQRCLKEITERFTEEQKAQDHTHGTMGISLRGAITELNDKVYKFELFVRDKYALKEDVKESISDLRKAIASLASDIKTDFKELHAKIDAKTS